MAESSYEARIRWCESNLLKALKWLRDLDKKVNQALQNRGDGGAGGTNGSFFDGYTTSIIPALSGNVLANTGTVTPCFRSGTAGLTLTATGGPDIHCTNSTSGDIPISVYVTYVRVGKTWDIIKANCVTAQAAPATAPAAPTGLLPAIDPP